MELIAQTNLQLYNQLRAQGYSDEQLAVVHRAYEFLITIYSGWHQADGKPFIAHTVGVASIVGYLNFPIDFVAVGLLHNIYGNGDFGDGLSYVATKRRRRIVRKAVGERIEAAIHRFPQCRIREATLPKFVTCLDQLDETDKKLIVIDLADYLEKYIDLGVYYWGNSRWVTDAVSKHGDTLIAIANRLGYLKLAAMLNEAFAQADAAQIPDFLRAASGRKEMDLIVPRSCRRRLPLVLRRELKSLWRFLRRTFPVRRRLRQLRSAIGRLHTIQHSHVRPSARPFDRGNL
jgi:(p)ppGpp synthase/HD superfamily hydrolase